MKPVISRSRPRSRGRKPALDPDEAPGLGAAFFAKATSVPRGPGELEAAIIADVARLAREEEETMILPAPRRPRQCAVDSAVEPSMWNRA